MIKTWLVRLELARDDDGAVSEDVIAELTRLLTEDGVRPVLSAGDAGAVLVQLRVDGRDDQEARAEAERMVRGRAQEVWTASALPPFTIAVIESGLDPDPGS